MKINLLRKLLAFGAVGLAISGLAQAVPISWVFNSTTGDLGYDCKSFDSTPSGVLLPACSYTAATGPTTSTT
ncbi:MAG: hypothetical protein M3R40_09135, partial [Pseudomonadota bacterium]|nr:hypothetical protein [Pseudomonadota bacterium]